MESSRVWAEATSIFINNHTIGMNRNWNNVFLHRNRILIISLSVEELPQPRHLVISNLFLCLQFGFKDHIAILITDQRDWPLAECVCVNAESLAQFA